MYRIAFALALACLLLGSRIAFAETLTVEGSVKAVDVEGRLITITRKTQAGEKSSSLELDRSASITIDGKPAQLNAVLPGQQATISYNSELELVTKVVVTGSGTLAPEQRNVELVQLSEIGTSRTPIPLWVSDDGLTIYWEGTASTIWTAKRETPASLFADKKLLFNGRHPTVSRDGLEMILLAPRTDGQKDTSLHTAVRESVDKPFGRPTEIRELRTPSLSPKNPCLSADGLTLYFNMPNGNNGSDCLQSRRATKNGPWGKPTPIPFASRNSASSLTWFSLSDDGLTLFCTEEGGGTSQSGNPNLMIWRRSDKAKPFAEHEYVTPEGLPVLIGRSPRYVRTTKELFFTRATPPNFGIWVVKGFEPIPKGN